MKRLKLKKWARTTVQTINIMSFIIVATLNDFNGIVGLISVLTVLALFIGSAMILSIDDNRGW